MGERDDFKYLGVDGRIILKWVLEKRDEGMNWIDPAEDRER